LHFLSKGWYWFFPSVSLHWDYGILICCNWFIADEASCQEMMIPDLYLLLLASHNLVYFEGVGAKCPY
jgi:hypothetical protein